MQKVQHWQFIHFDKYTGKFILTFDEGSVDSANQDKSSKFVIKSFVLINNNRTPYMKRNDFRQYAENLRGKNAQYK